MPVRSDSVVGQVAEATRRRRPLFRVTVSPRLARFLIAAGAQPAARADVVLEQSASAAPAAPVTRWQEVGLAPPPSGLPRASGKVRKMAVYLGLVEDDHGFDLAYAYDDGPEGDAEEPEEQARRAEWLASSDLAKARTVRPRSYNDPEVRVIGEAFRRGSPVLMDLTEMSDSDAERVMAFVAGLMFGPGGRVERVSRKVLLLIPADVAEPATNEAPGREAKA